MPVSSFNSSLIVATLLLSALSGCGPEAEIDRPGTWRSTGVNDRNLRAMIADPADLDYGAASQTERGSVGARAVTRVVTDRRRPLLDAAISRTGSGSTGGDTAPALPASGQ